MQNECTPSQAPPVSHADLWGTEDPPAVPEDLQVCPFTRIHCSAWDGSAGCAIGGCEAMLL